jgi:hypothetical protein
MPAMLRRYFTRPRARLAAERGEPPCWMDGFLSRRECEAMLEELRWAFWKPSAVVTRAAGGRLHSSVTATRVSESTHEEWFTDELCRQIAKVEKRLRAFGVLPERCESWQATRYHPGGTFDYHFDSGYWAAEPAGERERTVLVYLERPAEGGSTRFRELSLDVEPAPGRLLIWNNLLPGGERNPAMLHSAAPVVRGTKTVLVTWTRERDIDSKKRR